MAPTQVRAKLAQRLLFLRLALTEAHNSEDCSTTRTTKEHLDSLQLSLPSRSPSPKQNRAETQSTAIGYSLLNLAGGYVELKEHRLEPSYTTDENAKLCAKMLGITSTIGFREIDYEKIRVTLSESLVFSGEDVSVSDIKSWTMELKTSLCLGYPEGYMVRLT